MANEHGLVQEAHALALKCTKGLAAIALKVLTDDKFYVDIKEAFEAGPKR
jgi:hypothetical protein